MALGFASAFALSNAASLGGTAIGPAGVPDPLDGFDVESTMGHLESELQLTRDLRSEIDLTGPEAEIRFTVANRFRRPARFSYAVALVDERGEEVEAPFESAVARIAKDEALSFGIEIPRSLPEGFYLARVIAAGRAGNRFADDGLEIGFAVVDGAAYLLSDEEWYEHSLANMGVPR
jgi:hypothetical protein